MMLNKCQNCNVNPAQKDPLYGFVECEPCQNKQHRLDPNVEFTTQSIKEQRNEYLADTLQPYRDGVLSKEYLDTYGTLGIKPTKQELKNAKEVWKDIPNINNLNKTQKTIRKRKIKND